MTPKQVRFVQEYLIDSNATQAAIRAGYSKKTAHVIGHENLNKPEISEALKKAQTKIAERCELSAEKVLRDLEEARVGARSAEQFSSVIRAIELQAKALKEANPFAEQAQKHEIELKGGDSLPELSRRVAFLLASGMKANEAQPDSPALQ